MKNKISLKYGLLTAGGLLILFLIMQFIGLAEVTELRVLNLFIVLVGIYFSIKERERKVGDDFSYFGGFSTGFLTAVFAVIPFALCIGFYLAFLNPGFLESVKTKFPFAEYLNPLSVTFALIAEGLGSGAVATLIIMQFEKSKSKKLNT